MAYTYKFSNYLQNNIHKGMSRSQTYLYRYGSLIFIHLKPKLTKNVHISLKISKSLLKLVMLFLGNLNKLVIMEMIAEGAL